MKSKRGEIRKRFVNWTPGYATIMWSGREGVAEKVEGQPRDDREAWGGSTSRSASKALGH